MKICIICNKEFKPNSNIQKCCSNKCFKRHRDKYNRGYRKRYYKENKEKILNQSKDYHFKNREEILQKQKIYRGKNKENIKISKNNWGEMNRNKLKEYSRKHYENRKQNPEFKKKRKLYDKKYYYKNTEKRGGKNSANRYIKLDETSKCEICGSKEKLNRHHPNYSKPLYVVILCLKCHKELHRLIKYPNLKEIIVKCKS